MYCNFVQELLSADDDLFISKYYPKKIVYDIKNSY